MAVSEGFESAFTTEVGDLDHAGLLERTRRVEKELRDLLGELRDVLRHGGAPPLPEHELTGLAEREREGRPTHLIRGMTRINEAIRLILEWSHKEVLLAQPGGARSKPTLNSALPTHLDCLNRGVVTRTLYQHPARYDQPTRDYVRATAEHGAQFRTLDEFFDRLIVVDRHVVIVPTNSERTEAAMFTDPAVARFAADLFERFWSRAIDFEPAGPVETASLVGTEVQEAIKRLVIEGKTDEQIGRRVGLKPRAVQNHLQRIKNELGAKSRSELCFLLGRQSVLDDLALEETQRE
ncbi:DNA-binding CsgD family transcriptional regulator [Catenulispora sp. GP43]